MESPKSTINLLLKVKTYLNPDFSCDIQKLPYVFKDPVKVDKKIDPRKRQFGSKIHKDSQNDVEYYIVKRIINPNTVELNNGLIIKLLGVDIVEDKKLDAITFLKQKTKGQKVFLKFDETKYDKDHNLVCYQYLKNKTFINPLRKIRSRNSRFINRIQT